MAKSHCWPSIKERKESDNLENRTDGYKFVGGSQIVWPIGETTPAILRHETPGSELKLEAQIVFRPSSTSTALIASVTNQNPTISITPVSPSRQLRPVS